MICIYKHLGHGKFGLIYRLEDYDEDLKSNILKPNCIARQTFKEFQILDTVNKMGSRSSEFEAKFEHRND